jgi:hypothetical protein
MSDASGRVSRRPSAFELLSRSIDRLLDLYPRPIRGYLRLAFQLVAAVVLLLAGVLLVAGLVHLIDSVTTQLFVLVHQ